MIRSLYVGKNSEAENPATSFEGFSSYSNFQYEKEKIEIPPSDHQIMTVRINLIARNIRIIFHQLQLGYIVVLYFCVQYTIFILPLLLY